MSSEDSLEERQNNEFIALQGIYGDQLKDLRQKRAWNKWCPLNLSITLYPQNSNSRNTEIDAKVDLHVVCSEKYPNEVPQLTLENPKGLSQTSLQQLKKELDDKALEYKGTEMIWQLCVDVGEFILHHYKPTMVSFYEEMLLAKREQEEKAKLQKQLEADRLRENMMREVQQRQELLKAEAKSHKKRQKSLSETEPEDEYLYGNRRASVSQRRLHSSGQDPNDASCAHKGTFLLDFGGRSVQRGQCLRHGESTSIMFTGIDTDTGELVEVAEWTLIKKNSENGQLLKNVSSIEQELNYLIKLKHVNLAQYLGFKHEVVDGKSVVYVLKELVLGSSCYSLFTSKKLKIDISFLKHLAKGVLNALDCIHRNNAVHKDLKDTCVFINEKGVVKVSDYSIHRRLLDLVSSNHGNYNRKADIYDFGQLVLRLLGYSNIPEVPAELPSDLRDLLLNCLNKDEKVRYTANQLLKHSFFHEPVEHFTTEQNKYRQDPPVERIPSPECAPLSMPTITGEGQSRINNEFQILSNLGKGAFGDVLKAQNKLDHGYYAIKRIRLLGHKKESNKKKIVREVTLLSKLNHENIVRYYGSWIETMTIKRGECEPDSSITTTETTEPSKKPQLKKDDFMLNDNIEEMAPSMKNIEISVTYDSQSQAPYEESSDDDSSSDEDDFKAKPNQCAADSDSDGIEFQRDTSTEDKSTEEASSNIPEVSESPKDTVCQQDYLYIQMEFCEKSTLKNAIENDLYKEQDRVWRLFREIVEGLAYIHQQGIIHRDLKPVNIFLASNDHVKIGDFGLATKIAIRTPQIETSGVSKIHVETLKDDSGDQSITKQVGTPLYVAPEIDSTSEGSFYNEKVDIYSLGIIFFEMCYMPLTTAMEKSKILGNLRSKDVVFPNDFPDENQTTRVVIKWLLNHDISKRPSSQELLQSKYLPPPVVEEQELHEFVEKALSNPSSKAYRHLISSCFQQTITPAQDITYDRDPTNPMVSKPLNVYEFVREVCVKYFKQHGAQNLATPLLMPRTRYYDGVESCVNLMTHFGNIVCLPHDLRVPFARYIAWNNVNNLRRYSVERVYKERKVFGFLPREFYECAFDIVSPNKGSLVTDAEILCVVHDIVNELPGFKNRNFQIRLNHTDLFDSILLYCGVMDKKDDLLNLLQEIKEGKVPKSELQNFLIQKGLSDVTINFLIDCLNFDVEMSKVSSHFQSILKKRTGPGELAKMGLQELKMIVQNAESYGVQFEFVIAPGLVYNIKQYSGMICQFVCDVKKKKRLETKEVVAVGGRYDAMISYYRTIMEQTNMPVKNLQQSAVGVSISLDRLAQGVQKADKETLPKMDALDTIVCSVGTKQLIKEKAKILRSLWAAGIKCALTEEANTVDVQEYLIEMNVSSAISLIDSDQGFIRLHTGEKDSKESNLDKFQEKLYTTTDLVENMQKIMKIRNDSSNDNIQSGSNLTRSESKSSYTEKNDEALVDVLLVTQEKLNSNVRRRYETQARSQLDDLFKRLSGHTMVIAASIEIGAVRCLASFLEFGSENDFSKSVQFCVGKFPKQKELLNEICDEIWELRTKKTNPTVVLFSLIDNKYKVIM